MYFSKIISRVSKILKYIKAKIISNPNKYNEVIKYQ